MVISSPAPVVGSAAWLELLHAEVCWSLAKEDVRCLVIKGPSIAQWLYVDDGERASVDVDVLVPPEEWDRTVEKLTSRGFIATHEGSREGETAPHSMEFHREDEELGRHSIDLHRYFPGIELPASDAFEVLWAETVADVQAGVPVWFPSLRARALVVGLHAARSPGVRRTLDDLTRMAEWADTNGWEPVVSLARGLEALPALRAGLELLPDGPAVVERAGLSNVTVTPEWALMSHHAGRTALRLEELREAPWHQRPGQVARWVVPSPTMMRIRDPRASEGAWGLTRAYGVRLGQGLRQLPTAIRAVHDARRR